MNNRPNTEQINPPIETKTPLRLWAENTLKTYENLGYALLQTGATVTSVSMMAYIPEFIQNRLQANMPFSPRSFLSPIFWTTNASIIRSGAWASFKNRSITHTITTNRDSLIGEKELAHNHPENSEHLTTGNNTNTFNKIAEPARDIMSLSLLDVTATQRNSVNRILNDMEKSNPRFVNNQGQFEWGKFLNFYKTGLPLRYTANASGLGIFYLTTSYLLPYVEYYFPKKDHGLTPYVMCVGFTGASTALFGNGLYRGYKYQVKCLSENGSAPSWYGALSNIYKQEGTKLFTKGVGWGMAIVVGSSFTVLGFEQGFKYIREKKEIGKRKIEEEVNAVNATASIDTPLQEIEIITKDSRNPFSTFNAGINRITNALKFFAPVNFLTGDREEIAYAAMNEDKKAAPVACKRPV